MKKITQNPENCAVVRTVGYIGGKWKPIILIRLLNGGEVRFGKLAAQMPDISRKILSQQLKELESDHLITRHSYSEKPPRVGYRLSDHGKTLIPILKAMFDWGVKMEGVEKNETWDPTIPVV